jgi:hypothetical protein
VVADALSRPPETTSGLAAAAVASVEPAAGGEIDYAELAADQEQCEQIKLLAASLVLRILGVKVSGVNLLCDMSTASPRPLVPEKWRRRVFKAVHELAHPGVRATFRLITSRFLWRGCAAAAWAAHAASRVDSWSGRRRPFRFRRRDFLMCMPTWWVLCQSHLTATVTC